MSQLETNYNIEEQDLNRTRQVRSEIITEMTKEGIKVDDPEKLRLLLTVLTDSDRSSLSRMKIKSEDKNNANNANSAAVIAKFLMSVSSNKQNTGDIRREAPMLPDTVPKPDVLPGETDIGVRNTTYEEFTKENMSNFE